MQQPGQHGLSLETLGQGVLQQPSAARRILQRGSGFGEQGVHQELVEMLGPAGTACLELLEMLLEDEGTQLPHPDRRAAHPLSNCEMRECMGACVLLAAWWQFTPTNPLDSLFNRSQFAQSPVLDNIGHKEVAETSCKS